MRVEKLVPKSTRFHDKFLETKKNSMIKTEKPLYKMRMFNNVGSKVVDGIKSFKTYEQKENKDSNLDNLIAQVENELIDMNTN